MTKTNSDPNSAEKKSPDVTTPAPNPESDQKSVSVDEIFNPDVAAKTPASLVPDEAPIEGDDLSRPANTKSETSSTETSAPEAHSVETSSPKVHAPEEHMLEARTSEEHPPETSAPEANASEKPSSESHSSKDRSPKATPSQESKSASKKSCPAHSCDLAAKNDRNFRCIVTVLLSLSLVASIAGLSYAVWDFFCNDRDVNFTYPNSDGNIANFTEGSIAEVAAKVAPGVVSILTEVQTKSLFGQSMTSTAAGTGMIVTEDGYVLTNKHVIDGAKNIRIVLDDGTTFEKVETVGVDPNNDVAYLKIKDASGLPTVTLGNSKTVSAGQQVIAIGNALGQFQNTITSGIISGTGRIITATNNDYTEAESLVDMIQTDAAINSGNSGGPLVNAAGEVIGINTATTSEADGIGFAIPISSVKGMLKNIIENKSAERSYLGVYYITLTPDIATEYNLPVSSGAYVHSNTKDSPVIANGPAAKAGIKDGDIIIRINGVPLGSAGSVSTLIGEYMPGDTVQLTVLRDNKEVNLNATLGSYKK